MESLTGMGLSRLTKMEGLLNKNRCGSNNKKRCAGNIITAHLFSYL